MEVGAHLHLRPYYGKEYESENELYNSLAKAGTTTFHGYATLYARVRNKRYTLAVLSLSQHSIDGVSTVSVSSSWRVIHPTPGTAHTLTRYCHTFSAGTWLLSVAPSIGKESPSSTTGCTGEVRVRVY